MSQHTNLIPGMHAYVVYNHKAYDLVVEAVYRWPNNQGNLYKVSNSIFPEMSQLTHGLTDSPYAVVLWLCAHPEQ